MSMDVVIVNHGTPELYYACVGSIHTHFPPGTYEIFGMDNSPNPVAPLVVPNLGYGNACNVGASKGSRPYILFLNADTQATPEHNLQWVEQLFDDPSIGVVGPKQLSPQGWVASAGCTFADNGVGYSIRGFREYDQHQYDEPVLDCFYVSGSVLFVRRAVWEQVGGLLEHPNGEFMQYYEDNYLCMAARHYGHRTVYTGQSTWVHHWDASPKPEHEILSGRQWVKESYPIFVQRLRSIGVPEDEIPPVV